MTEENGNTLKCNGCGEDFDPKAENLAYAKIVLVDPETDEEYEYVFQSTHCLLLFAVSLHRQTAAAAGLPPTGAQWN